MTKVSYEWTANDNKTKIIVKTLAEANELKEKFGGTYKTIYKENHHTDDLFWED